MEKLSFVIPLYIKGASYPSVMIEGELRPVRNPKSENYGKYSIYRDSHYEPLNINQELPLEEAKNLVVKNGGIFVPNDFVSTDVEDLRTIKHLLSTEWIEGFNNQ